jgi:hypothetical protein
VAQLFSLGVMTIKAMKRYFVLLILLGAATGIVFGFNPKVLWPQPPPRQMGEAYSMALSALGSATNSYYCVDARIGHAWCPWKDSGEWVFTFDANSVQHKIVYVAMRPYDTNLNPIYSPPYPLTEVRDIDDLAITNRSLSK